MVKSDIKPLEEQRKHDEVSNFLQQGKKLYKEGSWKEAYQCFRKVCEINPLNCRAWLYTGIILYDTGLYYNDKKFYQYAINSFNIVIHLNNYYNNIMINITDYITATKCLSKIYHEQSNQKRSTEYKLRVELLKCIKFMQFCQEPLTAHPLLKNFLSLYISTGLQIINSNTLRQFAYNYLLNAIDTEGEVEISAIRNKIIGDLVAMANKEQLIPLAKNFITALEDPEFLGNLHDQQPKLNIAISQTH